MVTKILRSTGIGCSMALALTLPLSNVWAACTSTVTVTTAHVTCDTASDNIVVSQNLGFLTHNFPIAMGSFNSNTDWDSSALGDQQLLATLSIQFDTLGAGDDVLTIGDMTTPADQVSATITIVDTGSDSGDQLVLDSSASSVGSPYSYDSANFFLDVNGLDVLPQSSFLGGTFISTGTGNDTVSIFSTETNSFLRVLGNSGNDTVSVNATTAILGDVIITNSAGQTDVTVDNSSNMAGASGIYSSTGITGLTPAPINLGTGVHSVSLTLGSGNDILHVTGTPSSAATNTINLGAGNDQCLITGSGLAATSTNLFDGGLGDDIFTISAVPNTVSLVSINGGSETNGDILNYTGGTPFSGTIGTGTLTPTNTANHTIDYTSIENFDVIFADSFE